MSLYKNWSDMVVDYVQENGEDAFWEEYGSIEKEIYTKVLQNHSTIYSGSFKSLAEQFETESLFFMGFLDGINDSLVTSLNLEAVTEETEIELKINLEELYFNMLNAKADYLYELSQWDAIFSKEKRKEITRNWKDSKTIVNEIKIGRNDACPCGSGKKYKKCCGK
jgi:preprotein translocase subunit SecA